MNRYPSPIPRPARAEGGKLKQMEKINNVSLGDMFISPEHKKSGRISTVVDFIERKSLRTGGIIDHECVAEYEFMGKKCTYTVAFSTVVRYKIGTTNQVG